jgi:two-component system, OmpR family, KDP operon response regulator KdpE
LTVRDREADKVAALDAGADDYVTKPFGMNELLARMRAQLRRIAAGTLRPVTTVRTEHFTVDLASGQVTVSGEVVRLTPKEWGIVSTLARNAGRLVARRELLQEVWGPSYEDESSYLRVYMAQIRKKLEPDPGRPRHFITEAGIGYRLEGTDEAPAG